MTTTLITTNFEVLTPAYGRDYASIKEAEASFKGGDDWCLNSLTLGNGYTSIRDFTPGVKVNLRFKNKTKLTTLTVPGTPQPAPAPAKAAPAAKAAHKASNKTAPVTNKTVAPKADLEVSLGNAEPAAAHSAANNSNDERKEAKTMTYTLLKSYKNGAAAYGLAGVRGRIYFGPAMKTSDATWPAELVIDSPVLAAPNAEAASKSAERAKAKAEREEKAAARAAERIAKATKNAEKATARLAKLQEKAAKGKGAPATDASATDETPAADQPFGDQSTAQ